MTGIMAGRVFSGVSVFEGLRFMPCLGCNLRLETGLGTGVGLCRDCSRMPQHGCGLLSVIRAPCCQDRGGVSFGGVADAGLRGPVLVADQAGLGNGGTDPYSSPYIIPTKSPHNPFPHSGLGFTVGFRAKGMFRVYREKLRLGNVGKR